MTIGGLLADAVDVRAVYVVSAPLALRRRCGRAQHAARHDREADRANQQQAINA